MQQNQPQANAAPVTQPIHPQGRMVGNQIIYDNSYRDNFFSRNSCTRNKVLLLTLIGFFAVMTIMFLAADIITVGILCLLATVILFGVLIWYYKLCQRNLAPNQTIPPAYTYQAQGQAIAGATPMYPQQQPYLPPVQVPPYPQGYIVQPPTDKTQAVVAQPYPPQGQEQPTQSLNIAPPPSYEQATNSDYK